MPCFGVFSPVASLMNTLQQQELVLTLTVLCGCIFLPWRILSFIYTNVFHMTAVTAMPMCAPAGWDTTQTTFFCTQGLNSAETQLNL